MARDPILGRYYARWNRLSPPRYYEVPRENPWSCLQKTTLRSPLVPFGIPLSLVRSPAEPAYGGLSHTRIEYHALPNKPFIALKNLKNPI